MLISNSAVSLGRTSLQSRHVMFYGIQVLHEMKDKAWCGCLLLTKGKQIRLTAMQVTDVWFRCYSNTTAQMKRDRDEAILRDKGALRNTLCPSVLWTMLLCSALLAVIKHGQGIFNSYLIESLKTLNMAKVLWERKQQEWQMNHGCETSVKVQCVYVKFCLILRQSVHYRYIQ